MKNTFKAYISLIIVLIIGAISYLSAVLLYTTPVKATSTPITIQNPSSGANLNVLPYKDVIVQTCTGNWLYIDSIGKRIELSYETVTSWKYESDPAILSETLNNKNTVLLGHNYCEGGNCYKPTTDFGMIINVKQGDKAMACVDGNLYKGEILVSRQIDETATYILSDWLNQPTITAFTCYGECKDEKCETVRSRWVIAFNKF